MIVIEEEVVPDYDEVIAEWVDILDVERVRRYYPRRRYIEISDEEETETIIVILLLLSYKFLK